MTDLKVDVKLDHISCYDEGDGLGNAEPYLWVVFFKVDGDTLVVNTDGPAPPFLQGYPTVVATPGNHGNLGTTDVDAGDTVPVPAIIGEYHTEQKPIPLTVPIAGVNDVGGMLGCLVVLMEEDGTPSNAVAHGHDALNSAVRDGISKLLATLSIGNPTPTPADIEGLQGQIGDAVKAAISHEVSVFDWLGAFGNMDDQIGSAVFLFSHKQLQDSAGAPIPFKRRWKSEGDWEIFGSITATPIRRAESDCCRGIRGRIQELEKVIAQQEKRLDRLEQRDKRPLEPVGVIKAKATVRQAKS